MATGFKAPVVPTNFVWDYDFYTESIKFRFLTDVKLMHSCTDSHTYVIDYAVYQRPYEGVDELLYDILNLNNSGVAYGQISFLSYYGDGDFLLEGATDRFKPYLIEQAFMDFGYKEPKLLDNFLSVSEKDEFMLKLKYGA